MNDVVWDLEFASQLQETSDKDDKIDEAYHIQPHRYEDETPLRCIRLLNRQWTIDRGASEQLRIEDLNGRGNWSRGRLSSLFLVQGTAAQQMWSSLGRWVVVGGHWRCVSEMALAILQMDGFGVSI
ncbi:hypothetical protein Patl1_21728 [Pistacia atlantica]|uniref:Uncharacterized protein n=1 Tax=Pistacia atlantica TaxID=434234 RepID=A0ACC1BLP4_9ROSI|nr:hypothetical protein Patl1_21728 [Pistacia atlantica]